MLFSHLVVSVANWRGGGHFRQTSNSNAGGGIVIYCNMYVYFNLTTYVKMDPKLCPLPLPPLRRHRSSLQIGFSFYKKKSDFFQHLFTCSRWMTIVLKILVEGVPAATYIAYAILQEIRLQLKFHVVINSRTR